MSARIVVPSCRATPLIGALLLLLAADGASAAAAVSIATSNASPVAGGAAFSYTITITSDVLGALNVRMTDPLPPGAEFQNLSISGPSAGAFVCTQPPVGKNGVVICEAAQMLAVSSAVVTVVATFDEDLSGGVRTNTARVVSDIGAAPVEAQVQQTVVTNSTLASSSSEGVSGSMIVRRLSFTVGGSGSRVLPNLTETLPPRSYLAWFEATGDLPDSCSFEASSATVTCSPPFLRTGSHFLTIVYGLPDGMFRNGFE